MKYKIVDTITTEPFSEEAGALCELYRQFGERGWCQATSGNFSVRVSSSCCLITQSGRDKSQLVPNDLMLCDLQGRAVGSESKPSAETLLHTRLYQLDKDIGAVLHTHSVNSTLLSRRSDSTLVFSGFEMQKALSGITSHKEEVVLSVFENDQDILTLANIIADAWKNNVITAPGFLIRGHGLYAWGKDIAEARRHVEGFEFLLECRWQETLAGMS